MHKTLCTLTLLCCAGSLAFATADSLITLTSSDLPIVVIDTHGAAIPDEPKIPADMGIIDNGPGKRNSLTDPFNSYNGKIGIETRGSSSTMFPKKQYAVETQDSAGGGLNTTLLGFPSQSDWVFSAPYTDKSLMRDPLLYSLARSMGRYASRSRYFELVLNGEYKGVYILLEKIKRDKNRVNVTKMSPADTLGDALTGGYIVKIDKIEGNDTQGWYSGFPPYDGAWQREYYQFHYPKAEDLTWPQRSYITRHIRDVEIAFYKDKYRDTSAHLSDWIDFDSFVDFFLLNELSKNVDAYRLSTYMFKDRNSKGGKLVMGPVWDFNLGFGNCDYYRASEPQGFHLLYLSDSSSFRGIDSYTPPFWWKSLFTNPAFQSKAIERWFTLRTVQLSPARISAVIDSFATILGESQARNFLRWSVLGNYVWPNAFIGKTYQDELNYMKTWIAQRGQWLDHQFALMLTGAEAGGTAAPTDISLLANYPNPFNPATTIRYEISDIRYLKLAVYDLLGREMAVLVDEKQEPGRYSVTWNAGGMASGVYICRMTAGGTSKSIRMLLLR